MFWKNRAAVVAVQRPKKFNQLENQKIVEKETVLQAHTQTENQRGFCNKC